jgi:aerobic-type carbon monoxide dehydrogenase small subunit (CoxS/CutS family)
MIMTAYALLLKQAKPTREQIVSHMDSNLCRCGAHVRIVAAVEEASRSMKAARKGGA